MVGSRRGFCCTVPAGDTATTRVFPTIILVHTLYSLQLLSNKTIFTSPALYVRTCSLPDRVPAIIEINHQAVVNSLEARSIR
jgi:hypothetical protein